MGEWRQLGDRVDASPERRLEPGAPGQPRAAAPGTPRRGARPARGRRRPPAGPPAPTPTPAPRPPGCGGRPGHATCARARRRCRWRCPGAACRTGTPAGPGAGPTVGEVERAGGGRGHGVQHREAAHPVIPVVHVARPEVERRRVRAHHGVRAQPAHDLHQPRPQDQVVLALAVRVAEQLERRQAQHGRGLRHLPRHGRRPTPRDRPRRTPSPSPLGSRRPGGPPRRHRPNGPGSRRRTPRGRPGGRTRPAPSPARWCPSARAEGSGRARWRGGGVGLGGRDGGAVASLPCRPIRSTSSASPSGWPAPSVMRSCAAAADGLVEVTTKSSATDMVTEVDRAAEHLIVDALRDARPGDGIIGEEGATRRRHDRGSDWLVDPIDGTTNFLYGLPGWAVSIAAVDDDGPWPARCACRPSVSCSAPARGHGAHLDGTAIRCSAKTDLATALGRHRLLLPAGAAGGPGPRSWPRSCPTSGTSAASAPRRSTSAPWPAGGSTSTSRRAWHRGTSRPVRSSPARPAQCSSDTTGGPVRPGSVVACPPALAFRTCSSTLAGTPVGPASVSRVVVRRVRPGVPRPRSRWGTMVGWEPGS